MARAAAPERTIAEGFDKDAAEYIRLKIEADRIKKRQAELKPRIFDYLVDVGEVDDDGHITVGLDDDIDGYQGLQRQRRIKTLVDEEVAEKLLKERGLWERCVEMVPQIQEDAVLACRFEDLLTEEEVEAIFPAQISYALVVKRA